MVCFWFVQAFCSGCWVVVGFIVVLALVCVAVVSFVSGAFCLVV